MKISVVVPNLNYCRFLPACLDSIASQSYTNTEVILIDAGSVDASRDVMKQYASRYGWSFYERPGESQVQSIRWGLSQSSGDVQCWLNSDDYYLTTQAYARIVQMFNEYSTVDCFSLGGYYTNACGKYLRPVRLHYHPLFRQTRIAYRVGLVQPATFWKRHVLDSVDLDVRLRYCFDSDFFIRICQLYNVLIDQNCMIAACRLHGSNLSAGTVKADRIYELGGQARKHTGSRARALYLFGLAGLIRALDMLPASAASKLKRFVYVMNNTLSYLSFYMWPSI